MNVTKPRYQQLKDHIIEQIDTSHPLVVAGDFNDWRGRASQHVTDVYGLEEVFRESGGEYARTFPSWMPFLRMDRVYTRGCRIIDRRQMHGSPWHGLSDHIPLMVELEL